MKEKTADLTAEELYNYFDCSTLEQICLLSLHTSTVCWKYFALHVHAINIKFVYFQNRKNLINISV